VRQQDPVPLDPARVDAQPRGAGEFPQMVGVVRADGHAGDRRQLVGEPERGLRRPDARRRGVAQQRGDPQVRPEGLAGVAAERAHAPAAVDAHPEQLGECVRRGERFRPDEDAYPVHQVLRAGLGGHVCAGQGVDEGLGVPGGDAPRTAQPGPAGLVERLRRRAEQVAATRRLDRPQRSFRVVQEDDIGCAAKIVDARLQCPPQPGRVQGVLATGRRAWRPPGALLLGALQPGTVRRRWKEADLGRQVELGQQVGGGRRELRVGGEAAVVERRVQVADAAR